MNIKAKQDTKTYLNMFTTPCWERNPVILVISLNEILHDRTTLEHTNLLAIGESIRQSGNASVGIDIQKPLFLLDVR